MAFHRGPHIIRDGLLMYLDAANGKSYPGTGRAWYDLSGNNNSGYLVNNPDFIPDVNRGSILFTNTNDYAVLPDNIGYTNRVSAFAWFKSNGTPSGNYHIIYGGQELEISVPTAGSLRVGLLTNTRYVSNHGSGLNDGEWHNIGFTFDGENKIAYIDGENVGSQSVSGTLVNSFNDRTIGKYGSSSTYYLNGNISNCIIYNRPLTLDEVKHNYHIIKGRFDLLI